MYGIFTNICPINDPNVGKYTIHGASGNEYCGWSIHTHGLWFGHWFQQVSTYFGHWWLARLIHDAEIGVEGTSIVNMRSIDRKRRSNVLISIAFQRFEINKFHIKCIAVYRIVALFDFHPVLGQLLGTALQSEGGFPHWRYCRARDHSRAIGKDRCFHLQDGWQMVRNIRRTAWDKAAA